MPSSAHERWHDSQSGIRRARTITPMPSLNDGPWLLLLLHWSLWVALADSTPSHSPSAFVLTVNRMATNKFQRACTFLDIYMHQDEGSV